MPFSNLPQWINFEWIRDIIHWSSQWIQYCPVLTLSTAKEALEKEEARTNFLTKFLMALAIQITTMIIGATGASFITLQIVQYRMSQHEIDIKAAKEEIKTARDENAATKEQARVTREHAVLVEADTSNRIGRVEARVSAVEERHKVEDIRRR